ncbi:MAG: hypothetical protein JSU97_06475 [Dehalococcoidia bacterium]|nr:MAG: hypothetical protein JSU97_06475 [Dehalococcoidia bacterium]
MSCERASKEFADALNDWVRLEEELKELLLSLIGTPGQPGEPLFPESEKFKRITHLMEERPTAYERHKAALAAFLEAKKRHRD